MDLCYLLSWCLLHKKVQGPLTLHKDLQRSGVLNSKKFSFNLKQTVVSCEKLSAEHKLQPWGAILLIWGHHQNKKHPVFSKGECEEASEKMCYRVTSPGWCTQKQFWKQLMENFLIIIILKFLKSLETPEHWITDLFCFTKTQRQTTKVLCVSYPDISTKENNGTINPGFSLQK